MPALRDPSTRKDARLLFRLLRPESGILAVGVLAGCLWMGSMALAPFLIGRAIDEVLVKNMDGVLLWTAGLVGLAALTAASGALRHRCDTIARLNVSYRTIRLVTRKVTELGARLRERAASGEIVAIGTIDITRIGIAVELLAMAVGSVVAIGLVAVVLLSGSTVLGLMVLLGAPLLLVATGPFLGRLHQRAGRQRDLQAELTNRASDIVSGLRVLRGVGGERTFGDHYREDSQRLRGAGVRVAKVTSVIEAAELLFPGVFVVSVLWVGARLTVTGVLTPGQLVAFYAYAAFLVLPMRTVIAAVRNFVGAFVAAGRVRPVLEYEGDPGPSDTDPVTIADSPSMTDDGSGVRVRAGTLTAVVSGVPEEGAALASRLGRYSPGEVTLDDMPLSRIPLEQLRRSVLVCDSEELLFSGPLREELGGGRLNEVDGALHTANADDIVESLPEGLAAEISEGGRTLSGGQRQRLKLARALVQDPPVLILVEPTSSVDAHTEALIAERLSKARSGRTTVLVTTSPLLLDVADEVIYLEDGVVEAMGTHRELLESAPEYAALVLRGEA